MRQIIKLLLSRAAIIAILILIQVVAVAVFAVKVSEYFFYWYAIFLVLSIVVVLWLLGQNTHPSFKTAWIILILSFPIFGGLFYLMFGINREGSKLTRSLRKVELDTRRYLKRDKGLERRIRAQSQSVSNESNYIANSSFFPAYQDTATEYLPTGEEKFERLKVDLRAAKHFIFMEYFIIGLGKMWGEILEILEEKVKEGVQVRVMYDDMGSISTLPYHYEETLRKKGIQCTVFNPFRPIVSAIFNNRDHRKIAVIDGYIGYTGGINLADEYINHVTLHGHWKDSAIRLEGEAVWSLTVMFLRNWNTTLEEEENYRGYTPHHYHSQSFESDGFVQPYGDSPLDKELVGQNIYMNFITKAKNYVYITTPYLIVGNEMMAVLELAAKTGTDVRIITPHVPDKWYVHMMTQASYAQLIAAGVKIYEYTPGFIHAKTFVADDQTATVGTVNLDYRSLFMHFECGVWIYRSQAVMQVKEDFLKTLKECHQVTLEECSNPNLVVRLLRAGLRVFAPLM